MAKIVIEKSVAEEIKKKLESYKQVKNEKNAYESGDFVEKMQNLTLTEENEQKLNKLQASKNIFTRGDFDEYKISDEELKECEIIEKSNIFPIGHITEHPDGSLSQKVAVGKWIYLPYYITDLSDKQTGNIVRDKQIARKILERMNLAMQAPIITKINPIQVPNGNEKFLAKYLKPYLDKIDNEIQSGNLRCKANGKTVIQFLRTHCYKNKNGVRKGNDLQNHAGYLPFVIPLIKKYGITDKSMNRLDKNGGKFIELVGRADIINPITNKKERVGISVVLVTLGNKTSMLKDISVFRIVDKYSLIKSFQHNSMDVSIVPFGVGRNALSSSHANRILPQQNNLSSKNVTKSLTYSGYKLQGRIKLYGMNISIENKKGTYRSGVDSDGHKWKTLMHYDYGYIRGTVGTDSDHVDCYIGPDKNAKKVYVIHQNNPITHKYDEDKCMLCFESAEAAKKAYMKQYDRPGFFGSMETLTIEQFKTFVYSKQGSRIHKSFDIEVTDITENNKQRKVEQVEKALNAIYNNKSFVINHISNKNDDSKKYENITLRIENFDKSKIEKAVHKLAFTLDTEMKAPKGEAFNYKSQEELTDRFINEINKITRSIYYFLIDYFDLPECTIVTKSVLRHKGKILYNPETGKPIKKSEWEKFVKDLEKFINKYNPYGEKITLSSEALGRILDRLSKTNSYEAIKKMKLSSLKYKSKSLDWISKDVKNLKNIFGESISRNEQIRIQATIDSATQRITNISDKLKNDIKQVLVDGIKNKNSRAKISQDLFNNCVGFNRDIQKIVDSEIQSSSTLGYMKEAVYQSDKDEKVYFKRFEQSDDNTCKKCKKLSGMIVLWSNTPLTSENIKDPYANYAIWEGKTDGDIPLTISHPYCRGGWYRYYPDVK